MLSPEQIQDMMFDLEETYAHIEDALLRNVAKRFSVNEAIAPDTVYEWQVSKLQELGALRKENIRALSAYSGKTEAEIARVLTEAGYRSIEVDEIMYREAHGKGLLDAEPLPITRSPVLRQILDAAVDNTRAYFNMINTTALQSADKAFLSIVNQAYLETALGLYDYSTAVRRQVRGLADMGVTGATYISENGRRTRNQIDVAVRRCVVTSVNQTAAQMQLARALEWGCNLVEVTSHLGARPTHAVWQGGIYSIEGETDEYPNLEEVTGYGDVSGLCGANCRHSFFPYIPGISTPTPYKIDLDENQRVYEESQEQRALEREIRRQKRRVLAAEATGDTEAKVKAQLKLREASGKLADFLDSTGRQRDSSRQQVLDFGRSQAQQAVWTQRKADAFKGLIGTKTNDGYTVTGVSQHFGERAVERGLTVNMMREALTDPMHVGTIKTDSKGRQSKEYMGYDARVQYNPETGTLVTNWPNSDRYRKKYGGGKANE